MLNALAPGSVFGISAPAGPVKPEKLERAVAHLHNLGYRTKLSPNVLSQDGFLSAHDDIRSRELLALFADPEVHAVWSARGGVGTSRLLARLDLGVIASSRKPFIGFSDLTALQWALWAKLRAFSFTGPLAVEFDGSLSPATESCAMRVLAGETFNLLDGFSVNPLEFLRGGATEIIAPALPGNLTMITTLLGTPWLPDLRGAMLFIEDVAEPPYRVDRLLFHLRNAGGLQNLAALVVGDFGWDPSDDKSRAQLRQSVLDATLGTNYPIILNFPYGHGRDRVTLPVGGVLRMRLDATTPELSVAVSPFIAPNFA